MRAMNIGETSGQYFNTTVQSIKKLVRKEAGELQVNFRLTKVSVNGNFRGISGFIENSTNGKIVYIDTDVSSFIGSGPEILYRTAKSLKDYSGSFNRYASNPEALALAVVEMLR